MEKKRNIQQILQHYLILMKQMMLSFSNLTMEYHRFLVLCIKTMILFL